MPNGPSSELQPTVDGDDAIDDGDVMTPVLNDLLQRMFPNVSLLWRKLLPAACYQNSSHSHSETKMSATISSRWGSIILIISGTGSDNPQIVLHAPHPNAANK